MQGVGRFKNFCQIHTKELGTGIRVTAFVCNDRQLPFEQDSRANFNNRVLCGGVMRILVKPATIRDRRPTMGRQPPEANADSIRALTDSR